MQKRREGSDNIFESRNAFSGFGDIGGFGSRRSMIPNLFGGSDPFDDPFFTRPFDSIFGPTSAPRNMQNMHKQKGVIIKELESDDEGGNGFSEAQDTDQKHSRSTMEPTVEHPDDDVDERKRKQVTNRNDHSKVESSKPGNFSLHTCRVTYGGVDGAYYTSTRTTQIGADGAVLEESKEADKTTGQATHRISRGIHDKGHSFTRRLNSDGKIDTMQTLHNLNEDELSGFEGKWKVRYGMHWNGSSGSGEPRESRMWRNWSCPSLEHGRSTAGYVSRHETNSSSRTKKVVRINIE